MEPGKGFVALPLEIRTSFIWIKHQSGENPLNNLVRFVTDPFYKDSEDNET